MLKGKILYTLTMILICSFASFSCNTSKSSSESSNIEKNALTLELDEALSAKYISTTYSEYNPSDISRSNRTLNQYAVSFTCSSSAFTTLKNLINEDSKVKIIQIKNTPEKQSSKSVKSAKTKSIRENN